MRHAWKDLDRILRGEATAAAALRRGTLEVSAPGVAVVLIVLAASYGVCMGCFALFGGPSVWQFVASTVKVPALFALTLLVTFPSLYVFNALVGSRLGPAAAMRLLLASLAVTVAVLASLGPIVAFFSLSTSSYPFMVVLNVAVFAAAGVLGAAFLLQTLHRLSLARPDPPGEASEGVGEQKVDLLDAPPPPPGALDRADDQALSKHVKTIFGCWIFVFGLVGSQMGWVLRPFIGQPDRPFSWFRPRDSSFFRAVGHALAALFS